MSWNSNENDDTLSFLEDQDDLEDNYYSILNVSKEASDREITQAYHRLGLVYHPDKHKNLENKRNAEILFAKAKKAYDVLIDPHKRAIYDSIGSKGLKQNDLQLIVRSKSPQEIRAEYERLARENEERRIEMLTSSQGHFKVVVDATNLFGSREFDGSENFYEEKDWIKISDLEIKQSVNFPLTNKNTVTFGGKLNTQDNYGSGIITSSFKRVVSANSYVNVNTSIGAINKLSISAFKLLTQLWSARLTGTFRYKNGHLVPKLSAVTKYQLDDHLVGELDFQNEISDRPNALSSMSVGITYEKDENQVSAKFVMSPTDAYICLSIGHILEGYDCKLKGSVEYGFVSAGFMAGIEKQVTKYSRVDAQLLVNTVSGVFLSLQVNRGDQIFALPIHLTQELSSSAMFYGCITPLAIYYIAKKLIIDPYQRENEETEAKNRREKLKTEIDEKKNLALAAQELMKETVARIIEKETPNGLIIKKATYGRLIDKNKATFEPNKSIDVTIPLQFNVQDHVLLILGDQDKSNLEGFYDPCLGESKSLLIEYNFKSEAHSCIVGDNEILRLPKASHKLSWWSK